MCKGVKVCGGMWRYEGGQLFLDIVRNGGSEVRPDVFFTTMKKISLGNFFEHL